MSSQELQVVTSVLGRFPPLDALRHLAPAISSFLGPAPTLSFKRACELGSTKLLDWIWITSCTSATDRSPRWSLTNYLRSDPYYYRWQFAEALEVAAGRGDLAAVEWLFTHFSGCMAPVNVVEAAAKNGHEHVLSYLLEHDAGAESPFFLRAAMNLNGQPAMERVPRLPDGWNGPGNAVTWGGHSMLYAVENKHVEAAMWLFERPDHELGIDREGGLEANEIICAAVSEGLFELAAKVMARTQRNLNEWLIHYSLDSPVPEYVEVLLENGYFQSFEQAGRRALRPLARTGHLELLQRVVQVCEPCIAASGGGWNYGWLSALMAACQNGHLPVIRFLMEHTTWLEATEFRQPDIGSKFLLKAAAEQNSVDVLEYLVSRGVSDPTGEATCTMVYHGKLELVKWMLEHTSHISNSLIATLFCVAAGHNKVEILQYLLDLVARDSPDRTFHFKSDQIVASAASAGHLQLVEWLFARGFECSDEAVQAAARSGRLEVVKWLHEHTSAECTEAALDSAATNGHAEVVKWLYENQPKRCSREAFGLAVSKCHFKVAYLLQQQYPDHAPVQAAFLPLYLGNDFDLLLFLHHHYPAAFTPDNVARARDDSAGASVKTTFEETRNWLRDLLAILA